MRAAVWNEEISMETHAIPCIRGEIEVSFLKLKCVLLGL